MTRVYAIRVHRTGGPEELRYEEVELGTPGPGEALVRHTAIGLNFTDIHFRTGRYPLPSLPHVIGMEAAGVVEAVGAGVTEVSVGDRVCYASEKPRAYAQAVVMPVTRLIKIPDWMDDETAAASILKGLTAQYLIRGAYPVQAGETILIQAAAGGVGLIMCQWAHHLGATVIGTVSTEEKAALARQNGCDHTILYTREDVVATVKDLTGGNGLPVVFDGVGGPTIEASLEMPAAARHLRVLRHCRRTDPAVRPVSFQPHGLALFHQRGPGRLHRGAQRNDAARRGPVRRDAERRREGEGHGALPARRCRTGAARPRGAQDRRQRDPGAVMKQTRHGRALVAAPSGFASAAIHDVPATNIRGVDARHDGRA